MMNLDDAFARIVPHLVLAKADRGWNGGRCLDSLAPGVACLFLRHSVQASFTLPAAYGFLACAAGGWLLLSDDSTQPTYWAPHPLTYRKLNADGHILQERPASITEVFTAQDSTTLRVVQEEEGWRLDGVLWRFDRSEESLVAELQALAPIETQGYFLLGSHTRYRQPSDLYRHLIFGWVYEDRYSWPHKRRICSENDAHALHLIFSGLQRATGKRTYGLLKAQLLLAVLSRQSEDGGYRHGEWTEHMESHYRLHCSAMHLMMDALSEVDDPVVRAALARGMAFIADKHDVTEVGAWFYHDELELTKSGMNCAPFKWLPGQALGKSPQNMLVLNTHLDTLIALDRYRQLTGDARFSALVESGVKSAHALLALRSAEWLYRLLFSAINLTLLPTAQAMRLPIWMRLWKRIGWQVFIPHLYQIKNRFPRLVMPGGYIDRHLGLGSWAFHYLTVNIMDLTRARRRFGGLGFDDVLHEAARFTHKSGVRGRWKELKYERYALGFWAEALWHMCQEFPDHAEYQDWYKDACSDLEAMNMGLPPSQLRSNAEAMATI